MFVDCGSYETASYFAVKNPNFPIEMLKEVLGKGVDDYLSKMAAENPNCPLEVKIKWMKKIGKITRFDPDKHEV